MAFFKRIIVQGLLLGNTSPPTKDQAVALHRLGHTPSLRMTKKEAFHLIGKLLEKKQAELQLAKLAVTERRLNSLKKELEQDEINRRKDKLAKLRMDLAGDRDQSRLR